MKNKASPSKNNASSPANAQAAAWSRHRIAKPESSFSLSKLDPGSKPFSSGDKARDQQQVEKMAVELDELQNRFYADRRYKMLVVLQGTDTSGKDGTLRAVFGRMSPLGVRTVGWKAPSEAERAHDFLWRIHQQVPASGEIVVFNRSHYEDVLVPVVEGWIDRAETQRRYEHINNFERLLAQSGTVVMKFMLHISKDEQRKRLQERIDDPTKRYKFQRGDLKVREQWDDYQRAYQEAIVATSTKDAPWVVVPADSKTHRNLMIALALREALQKLPLRYPDEDSTLASLKVK
jgi:PPK2 family polyphosphate:nucleotide phosphotransferase